MSSTDTQVSTPLQRNIRRIIRAIVEPDKPENESRVVWANQNLREKKTPKIKILKDFLVTLQIISKPSRVGFPNQEVIGTSPNEKLEHTMNTIMTLSVSVYSKPESPKAEEIADQIQSDIHLERVQVLMRAAKLSLSTTEAVSDEPFTEEDQWVARSVVDIILLGNKKASEDIDIIETTTVKTTIDGVEQTPVLIIPPDGGP